MHLARRWDLLGLRRWYVPTRLRHRLASRWLRRRGAPALTALGPEDVVFAPGEDGDTLIAVCRAPMAQPARES
jgi:hypothetical protein